MDDTTEAIDELTLLELLVASLEFSLAAAALALLETDWL